MEPALSPAEGDPATGRFLGQDPLGGGYAYAGNNPVNRVDPTGLYYIGGWSDEWQGVIEFDSTEVGLSPCDIYGHCYIWSTSGTIELDPLDFAPPHQASGENEPADAIVAAVTPTPVPVANPTPTPGPSVCASGGTPTPQGACPGGGVSAGDILNAVITVVQVVDVFPIEAIPVPGAQGVAAGFDVAAGAGTEYQILTGPCPGNLPAHAANLANLGVGLFADIVPPFAVVDTPVEASLLGATLALSQCGPAQ